MIELALGDRVKLSETGSIGTIVDMVERPEANFNIFKIVWDSDHPDSIPDAHFEENIVLINRLTREEVLTSANPYVRALNDNPGYVPKSNTGPP